MNTATLNPKALYWVTFNRMELRIPGQAVLDIARSGPNDAAVAEWAPGIAAQVEVDNFHPAWKPTPEKIRAELKEYGAWNAEELADDEANWHRLVWIAAWNIFESDEPDCREPLKG